ncbi:MAG: hypothetical protein LBQ50_12685 [Planctomycetaceae bacterium]|jgi:hypothetical protein|nr:hypothetical protein [Planctomycetaceae bacterium]
MDFEKILKDASKEEGAGQFVLFDDEHQFLGQYCTVEEVSTCIEKHHLKCPTLYDLGILDNHTYIFIGGQLHVI